MEESLINYPVKLVKFAAAAGVASRRKTFDIIMAGMISVNGVAVSEPSTLVYENDLVEYKGRKLAAAKYLYIALNKPRGYVCTNDDPFVEKKALDLIDISDTRLFSVGRLDKNSEGLIIFTNDGDFANSLSHPSNMIMKRYLVSTDGKLSDNDISKMKVGILDDGEMLKVHSIEVLSECKYLFSLYEGKNREIRRLIEAFQLKVKRLKRISIGNLKLDGIELGKWKYIDKNSIIS